jgi:hypothetical protein
MSRRSGSTPPQAEFYLAAPEPHHAPACSRNFERRADNQNLHTPLLGMRRAYDMRCQTLRLPPKVLSRCLNFLLAMFKALEVPEVLQLTIEVSKTN